MNQNRHSHSHSNCELGGLFPDWQTMFTNHWTRIKRAMGLNARAGLAGVSRLALVAKFPALVGQLQHLYLALKIQYHPLDS